MKKEKSVVDVLKENGASEIEGYCLINNYGYTFKIGKSKYDVRYWANCYGVSLDRWEVMSCNRKADGTYKPVPKQLKEKLERELKDKR